MGGGVLAITVPPYSPVIVSGHVGFWNAGLLLYRLALAGLDCSEASVKTYDYDISAIVRKKDSPELLDARGNLRRSLVTLKKYLPPSLNFTLSPSDENDIRFYGNIKKLNWQD